VGCDCTNYFPKGTKEADVEEFLLLLGFKRGKKGPFSGMRGKPYYYDKDDDYRHITGLYVELYRDKKEPSQLKLWTRTTISRSKFDSELHNNTVRHLKKRFGGHFVSDEGRNRYFTFDGPVREKAEAGAFMAFSFFDSNIKRAQHVLSFAGLLDDTRYRIQGVDFMDSHNPRVVTANIVVPFLVSAFEDYFRTLYIALLRYSDNRERIIQNARLPGAELAAIDRGELTVLDAVAKWMSFQDMRKISGAFKELSAKFDVHGWLRRPYGRQKQSFWDQLNRLIDQRHDLIHRAEIATDYTPHRLQKDLELTWRALWRVYQELIRAHGWQAVERWEL
jgi:hypothetical protein